MNINLDDFLFYLEYVIDGRFSDQVIIITNIILINFNEFMINNFIIIWTAAVMFQKIAEKTSFKWDDYWSGKLIKFLTRFKNKK